MLEISRLFMRSNESDREKLPRSVVFCFAAAARKKALGARPFLLLLSDHLLDWYYQHEDDLHDDDAGVYRPYRLSGRCERRTGRTPSHRP